MLRRYNSKNLDTILLKSRRTTIGSAPTCDVVVKGKGIAEVHASIESNSTGYFLKEHSLSGITRVNDRPVFGQVEIHSGDSIQVGSSPPFVFDSEWMFGTRPNSAATPKVGVARRSASASTVPLVEEEERKKTRKEPMLPMIEGKKIHPQSAHQSLSDSSVKKRTLYSRFGKEPSSSAHHSLRSSASSTESHNRAFYSNPRSIGNNLLQRVVKLQAEVIEKDERIRQLSASSTQSHQSLPNHFLYYHPTLPPPPPPPHHHHVQQAPPLQATPPLQQQLAPLSHRSQNAGKPPKSFELFAYRAFVGAITSQLRQFNDRVIRQPQRDSAELFSAMCRAVDVPLASRIGDIEKYCEAVLIDNDFEDGDELMGRLDNFIRESRREKILELTNELEVLMPLIRDAASNARENIKVCSVFTQWSRQFGDLLRKNSFSATTLFQAIEDLKVQFSEAHMSRHWLPPSITPILRLAALEIEKRDGDITPLISPRKPAPPVMFERRKSVDMTLDTCISQVETLSHEMDYHVVRLNNKARDYSTFQPLDLETVTRISKVLESMRSSVDLLAEHAFKEERPNSVMFFEITNEDIKNEIRKSDGEGSSGSLSSLKRISAPPKIPDVFSEDEEILEERRQIEGEMSTLIADITQKIGDSENVKTSEGNLGMISVNATVLKMLLLQSQRLLSSYESSEEMTRRKRSAPPMILVEDEEIHEVVPVEPEEMKKDSEDSEDVKESEDVKNLEEVEESEDVKNSEDVKDPDSTPICAKPAQPISDDSEDVAPLESPILNLADSEDPTTPEIVTPREEPEDVKASEYLDEPPESPESEEEEVAQLKKVLQEAMENSSGPEFKNEDITSSEPAPKSPEAENLDSEGPKDEDASESVVEDVTSTENRPATPEYPTPKIIAPGSSLPFTLIMPEQPGSPAQSMTHSPGASENVDVKESDDVEKDPDSDDSEEDVEDEEDGIDDESEEEEEAESEESEKVTVMYIPSDATPQELTPQNSGDSEDVTKDSESRPGPENFEDSESPRVPIANGHVLRETRSEDQMSSHLKSHINTANGKPHITYQYPIHRYHSPPMKRRSKSEDQKIRETLKNRPRFVLY